MKVNLLNTETNTSDDLNLVGVKWYEKINFLSPADNLFKDKINVSPAKFPTDQKNLFKKVEAEYKNRLKLDSRNKNKNKNKQFDIFSLSTKKSGEDILTSPDKIAALTLQIKEDPIKHLNEIELLLAFCTKKHSNNKLKHKDSFLAISYFADLLINDLLIPNRKLKEFEQNLQDKTNSMEILLIFYFEDRLKEIYKQFIAILANMLSNQDNILIYYKGKILNFLQDLFLCCPENEKSILTLIVNCLANSNDAISNKSTKTKSSKYNNENMAHRVLKILQFIISKQYLMKFVIVQEVNIFLITHRQNFNHQYFGIIFLNQILFNKKIANDRKVAKFLIEIYIRLFKELTSYSKSHKKSSESDLQFQRSFLAEILRGVNRALPYSMSDNDKNITFQRDADLIEMLYKILHTENVNLSFQAANLLYIINLSNTNNNVKDSTERFYSAIYSILILPEFVHSSRSSVLRFHNLIYKMLSVDNFSVHSLDRICAFVKRMLQISMYSPPYFICSALSTLVKLIHGNKSLITLITQKEDPENSSENYDSLKRNPLYSNASNTCFWELIILSQHFHPTVALFAKKILSNNTNDLAVELFSDTQINDLSLISFFNQFLSKPSKKPRMVSNPLSSSYSKFKQGKKTPEIKTNIIDENTRKEFDFMEIYEKYQNEMPDTNNFLKKKKKKTKKDEFDDFDMGNIEMDEGSDIPDDIESQRGDDYVSEDNFDLEQDDIIDDGKNDEEVFADALDYADMMESDTEVDKHHQEWESSKINKTNKGRKRKK